MGQDRSQKRGFTVPGEAGHPLTAEPTKPAAAGAEAQASAPADSIDRFRAEVRLRCLEALREVRFPTPTAAVLWQAAAELEQYVLMGAAAMIARQES